MIYIDDDDDDETPIISKGMLHGKYAYVHSYSTYGVITARHDIHYEHSVLGPAVHKAAVITDTPSKYSSPILFQEGQFYITTVLRLI